MDSSHNINVKKRKKLYKIGYYFMIANCCIIALLGILVLLIGTNEVIKLPLSLLGLCYLLPMLYLIPMTIFSKKHLDNIGTKDESKHLAFNICCLIFCNLVSGILFLIAGVDYGGPDSSVPTNQQEA